MVHFLTLHLGLVLGSLLAALIISHVLRQPRSSAAGVAWLLAIILVPYVGVPLYLLFGTRKMRNLEARQDYLRLSSRAAVPRDKAHLVDRLLRKFAMPGATTGNSVHFLTTGEESYHALKESIENAAEFIYIMTYLFHEDEVGQDILRRLTRRAREGLQVKLLLDGIGSLFTSKQFFRPLKQAGGKTAFYMPLLHRPFVGRTNLRNHRKIVIVDGCRVLAGGNNIAREYIGPTPWPDRWQDLSFVLEGPAVDGYFQIFRYDWNFASGDILPDALPPQPAGDGEAVVQVVPSGPDVPGDSMYDALISAIFTAQKRFWVVTPYFVPDDALVQAMILAAQRGIDLRILVPQKSNHRIADLARGVNLRQIHQAGGRIMFYQQGMVHAKALLVDDDLAAVGSANLDMRSLFLDHEVMLFIYSAAEITAVENYMLQLMAQVSPEEIPTSPLRDITEGVVRIISPLL